MVDASDELSASGISGAQNLWPMDFICRLGFDKTLT
jgi:hypothetical protein